jgi:hypothetical protein
LQTGPLVEKDWIKVASLSMGEKNIDWQFLADCGKFNSLHHKPRIIM